MAVGRTGVVAIAFASATLLSSIITIAVPFATILGVTYSGAAVGGYWSGLTVTSFVLALGAVGAAAHANVKKHSQSWLAAAALTFLVFVFELAAFANLASQVSKANSILGGNVFGYGPTFAFAIITWLLSMPTMAFCFMASKSPAPAQAQAPAQAEPVKATAAAPQGIASV
jgi:hypothetical protein